MVLMQNLDLDVVRRSALRWPICSALDAVVAERSAVFRCVLVGKAITPVLDDKFLGEEASRAIEALRQEAYRRNSGGLVPMPPLAHPEQLPLLHPKERNQSV